MGVSKKYSMPSSDYILEDKFDQEVLFGVSFKSIQLVLQISFIFSSFIEIINNACLTQKLL